MNFDASPMHLSGLSRILQHRQEQIAHTLQFDFTGPSGFGPGDESIDATAIELLDPEADHAIGPVIELANGAA